MRAGRIARPRGIRNAHAARAIAGEPAVRAIAARAAGISRRSEIAPRVVVPATARAGRVRPVAAGVTTVRATAAGASSSITTPARASSAAVAAGLTAGAVPAGGKTRSASTLAMTIGQRRGRQGSTRRQHCEHSHQPPRVRVHRRIPLSIQPCKTSRLHFVATIRRPTGALVQADARTRNPLSVNGEFRVHSASPPARTLTDTAGMYITNWL